MSHEQNMHHHLIYLATFTLIAYMSMNGSSSLTSVQVIILGEHNTFIPEPPSTVWFC